MHGLRNIVRLGLVMTNRDSEQSKRRQKFVTGPKDSLAVYRIMYLKTKKRMLRVISQHPSEVLWDPRGIVILWDRRIWTPEIRYVPCCSID